MQDRISSGSTQTQFPHKLRAAFDELKFVATHPHLAKAIMQWWSPDYTKLFELKKNGSGKQVIMRYSPHVFQGFINLALSAYHMRAELTREQKEAYVAVLTASGLLTAENTGNLLNVSRTTVTAWGARRAPTFPTSRIGGSVNSDTLMLLADWWKNQVEYPNDASKDWMLVSANRKDATWSVLARLTGLSMYEIQRNVRRVESGRTETLNVTVNPTHHVAAPIQADAGVAGHPAPSVQDGPEGPDESEVQADSLLRPPVTDNRGDAFAPAVYLAPVSQADAGDARQPDNAQDGVSPGSEGDRRDGKAAARRPVHAFFQPDAD